MIDSKKVVYFQSLQRSLIDNFIRCGSFDSVVCELSITSDDIMLVVDDNKTRVEYLLGYGYIDDSLQLTIYTYCNHEKSVYDIECGIYENRCKFGYRIRELFFDVQNSGRRGSFQISAK